jgi:hypothetical protein
MSDDAEARRRRAEQLRKQIADLTGKAAPPDPAARRDAPRVTPSSPRERVEERMRELDQGEGETRH